MSDSFQSICQQFPWTSDVHSDETFSTETVHRTGIDHQPMFFNLTFTMRSLKLIVFVTDSFETFEYNGIVRTKDVTPYSLFGDFLLL